MAGNEYGNKIWQNSLKNEFWNMTDFNLQNDHIWQSYGCYKHWQTLKLNYMSKFSDHTILVNKHMYCCY